MSTEDNCAAHTPYPYDSLDVGYLSHIVAMLAVLSYQVHKAKIDRLFIPATFNLMEILWPKSYVIAVQAVSNNSRLKR